MLCLNSECKITEESQIEEARKRQFQSVTALDACSCSVCWLKHTQEALALECRNLVYNQKSMLKAQHQVISELDVIELLNMGIPLKTICTTEQGSEDFIPPYDQDLFLK